MEGSGSHQHKAGVQLLAKCLHSGAADLVDVHVHLNAEWPAEDELQKADAILIYADGFTGHPALQSNHLEQLRTQITRGCGFLALHWATEVPKDRGGADFMAWMGGYCEPFWSVNPHWTADFQTLPPHPITSGVQPFSTLDEWYYHMRFRPGMEGVTPILTALPPRSTLEKPDGIRSGNPDVRKAIADNIPQHVAWASERAGGSRGFGFTGGHFHKGWGNDNQRKLVLNAILWAAHADVPLAGVVSKVTAEDLQANLDPKTPPPRSQSNPQPAPQSRSSEPNPLLSPKQAMERMTLPNGFSVDLVASEPLVTQPIAFCWDQHARLWVVEGHTYPTRMGTDPQAPPDDAPNLEQLSPEEYKSLFGGRDRILIFSDEDGDGRYETRKVFLENLNLVSGIEVGYGGVYLGAAPFLLHIPLAPSGDRPSGTPRVLADGFGWQDTHETLNSFLWGPDGWLYGCHGVFTQASVRNRTGPSGPRSRVPMNCAYWRWHPVEQKFEVFAHGTSNPWGLDYNAKGQLFSEACVIPHFWHVIQGAYYLRQSNPLGHFNPYVYKNIETIADHAHFVGKQSEKNPAEDAGGGHAHCGLAFYHGTLFPAEYRDRPYFGNIHGKRVNSERLLPNGSGYRASHAPDFLLSNDFNFTAVTLKTAPDGSLLISDWYDRQKCHTRQNEIWDRTNGRLYRVRTAEWKPWRETPGLWDPESTLHLQLQENGWLSRMARKAIGERSAKEPVPAALIEKATHLLASVPSPETRLRLLWWLHATRDPGNPGRWLRHLQDPDPDVRLWAVQLGVESGNPAPECLGEMKRLATADSSPVVRLALCSALQRIPVAHRWDLLEPLLQHAEDAQDPNLPQMLWYALEPLTPTAPERALDLARRSKLAVPAALIARRIGEMRDPGTLNLLLKAVSQAGSAETALPFLDAVLQSVKGRSPLPEPPLWKTAYAACSRFPPGPSSESVSDLRAALGALFQDPRCLGELRSVSSGKNLPLERRQRALQALTAAQDPDLLQTLRPLLDDPQLRPEVLRQSAAVPAATLGAGGGGLAFFEVVLDRFASLNTEERAAAVTAMAGRAETAGILLNAVQAGRVPRGEIPVFAARQVASLNVPRLSKQLEQVWGIIRSGDRDGMGRAAAEETARLKAVLTNAFLSQADLSKGQTLFKGSCGQCHQLFGEGGRIGPDLTGSNRANLDYLLENVTNPNAVIGKDYELHVWTLKDGRTVSGMLRQENAATLTVQTPAGEEQIPKSAVQSEEKPGISMMPAGLFSALSREQLRDLVGYLRTPRQVPLPGGKAYSVPGVLEGETLRILSQGFRAGIQKMGAFRDGIWSGDEHLWWRNGREGDVLRLTLPVKDGGRLRLRAVLTRAPDYGVVRFLIDGTPLGGSIDLYGSKVTNTQELLLGEQDLSTGDHELGVEILGANPDARPGRMFGLDYLRLEPVR